MKRATERTGKRTRKRNFHLPMREQLYQKLQDEARREGLPATAVAREAIAVYLSRKQREAIDQAIHAYAQRGCDRQVDLDPDLEAAGVEFLLGEEA